jgi:hypothetical protein
MPERVSRDWRDGDRAQLAVGVQASDARVAGSTLACASIVGSLEGEDVMKVRIAVALTIAAAVAVISPAAAIAGTVALWHMDESSGTVMHDAAGSNNGTIHGATIGVPGYVHTAYQFSAGKAYVSVPSAWRLNPGTRNLSVVTHVKLTTRPATGDYDVVKKGDYAAAGGEYKVEILQSGQALCAFKGSKHYAQISGGPNLATGRWFTVTCTKTATAVTLKVAGKTFTNARAVGSIRNSSPVGIAAGPGMDYYKGVLDEIKISVG